MAKDNDWDDLDNEESEEILEEDEGTDFTGDFAAPEEVDKHFPKEEKVEFKKPPAENEAVRMMSTFNSIYEASTELATMVNAVLGEVKKVIDIGEKKAVDIGVVAKEYQSSFAKIQKVLEESPKSFEAVKHIADEISFMKNELIEVFDSLNKNILAALDNYV
ncbi:MAG: hypothetical protein QG567_2103, partial [Campylobacterota bacterium]|nr:hypothetical protein [Campylobacterota bacterium]